MDEHFRDIFDPVPQSVSVAGGHGAAKARRLHRGRCRFDPTPPRESSLPPTVTRSHLLSLHKTNKKMPSSITLTSSAYSLLLLHAAAHPQSTVTGFLLGKRDGSGAADGELIVDKVVPLAHHWGHLAAVEDVGLELVGCRAKRETCSSTTPSATDLPYLFAMPTSRLDRGSIAHFSPSNNLI